MREYDVSVAPCGSYAEAENALRAVLEPIGGLDWVKPGMKVAVKVNLVAAMKPDKAATTHPALVCALTKMLVERGATVTVGDSPGGIYNSTVLSHIYRVTGMTEAEKFGARLNDNFGQSEVSFPEAKILKKFTCTSYLLDADAIIDFCKLKSHGMMGMSAAAKNMFGAIPGTLKPEYHFKYPDYSDFADMLVDLDEFFKPRLSIADAILCMEGNGPTAGTPRKVGALAASFSPHKLDLLCAELIGLDRTGVPTLEAAYRRNLIPETFSALNIAGNAETLIASDFEKIAVPASLVFAGNGNNPVKRFMSAAGMYFLRARPVLLTDKCVGCGVCAKMCPAGALEITGGKARLNRKKCIRCFCCQEFCPKGAMRVKRSAAARIMGSL